ncbi:Beta-Casp domain protein [Gemmatirosa kalamazoonensis]|uniref:Beta-Casp domain protein n=1 Tax=Gemmatirosa kalamazoonensis TaxID=861299 RepID=W0RFA3_9BACT|nr:MBL fold metallo-hydrolase [Gemmatirosa kalamazoonensis]AHG89476.1 Beta-Casp domain protein [Gemmatirosa kalamazoonensis]
MQIEFAGAAREVTGSCHIVRANGRTILLDCGMFQGRRKEADEKNRRLPLPVDEIDAVVLSHAHIDHAGRLPFLVAEGYDKRIWATAATRDLCAYMLADSAHIQEKDAEFLVRHGKDPVPPLYGMRDAVRVQELMVAVPYHQACDVAPGIRATFVDAGHILGSASVLLDVTSDGATKRLVFSGDVGRSGLAIIRDPQPPDGAHAVIMESTYGDRDHQSVDGARETLGRVVRETAARGGRVLVPSFAVGRAQELIYDLHQLARDRAIPEIPIVVDSPLAIDTTTVFEMHPEVFDRGETLVREAPRLFRFPLLRYTHTVEESKALARQPGPMVIIAASGMVESGRILHHLAQGAADPRNTVLIVGFQAEHTLGRRIVERRETLKIFGELVPLRARVEVLNGYSAHADRNELRAWLDAVRATSPALGRVYLVHGEPPAQDALAASLRAASYDVRVPEPGQREEV